MRYEYEFIRIDVKNSIFTFKVSEPTEDYHRIVRERARQGWRLVQIFAPGLWGHGYPKYYELIFERETNPNSPTIQ